MILQLPQMPVGKPKNSDLVGVLEAPQSTSISDMQVIAPLCAVFRRKLKSEGLKYTPERAQVLDTIVRHGGVFDVEVIIEKVKQTGIRVSKATVYRTVKLLQEAGVVRRVHFDGEIAYYQMVMGSSGPRAVILEVAGESQGSEPALSDLHVAGLEEALRSALPKGLVLSGFRVHVFAGKG